MTAAPAWESTAVRWFVESRLIVGGVPRFGDERAWIDAALSDLERMPAFEVGDPAVEAQVARLVTAAQLALVRDRV